ncbi:helicase [Clostridium botulinum]|uniref:DNA 3'-5' helicase n=1 Tax=Clostridium botulinum (strain Okra / Type B1) TaxID=498213 RepID=B1IJU7_CLOBK|nr:3'-5' exonuclease [Clostridium botulinum]EKX80954.1 helicase, UvrD/REP/exonuclease [Clostridium botulinum CFSAN001628]ACA43400.1 helicase, UvrD/REP/exonuclease family protein [Clostridium botulinum B1 str. Okra]MBD5562669.1 UvrD-helicase domain-containing protein [Clostridium botulinum]MBD5565828.1 UvrD-helicase domain-containing protein [Clostridium botulinum]MBD5569654.1 UvrD-helicase domain-containing protein [Clostridium botulinum]
MLDIYLNDKQKKVINTLDKNILLLSSAGTGKTKTLSMRIGKIIAKDLALGEQILCLTFTNRACKEMKEKIIETVGKEGLKVTVKTFHSFCFDVIKKEAKKNTDISFDFTIYDEEDTKEIISELNSYKFNVSCLQRFINIVKEKSINYKDRDYKDVIDTMIKYNPNIFNDICKNEKYMVDKTLVDYLKIYGYLMVISYDKKLYERHGLDFNDLIIKVHDLFQKDKITTYWREKYKFIHIDEIQDTSEIEYNIVSKLFKNNNIMLSGDYYQTIYEWRGSNPSIIFDNYKKEFNPEFIVFDKNYRSSEILLKASYGFLTNAFGDGVNEIYKEGIEPRANIKGDLIEFKKAYDFMEEATFIFNKIKSLKVEKLSRVAILTRNNRINIALSEKFKILNSKLPKEDRVGFLLVDEFKFFRREEIKDVLAYLKLIVNDFDSNSLKRILKKFGKGIGERTIEEIEKEENIKIGVRLTDLIHKNTQEYGDYYELLTRELDNENVVVFDVESTGINIIEDEIVQIAGIKINNKGEVIESFQRFLIPKKSVGDSYLVHGFSDQFLKENGENKKVVLKDFLEFIKDTVIVGHNVTFDISILNSELERLSLEKASFKTYYDTLDIARRFYPSLTNHKLETLSKLFNTETKSSHDAMDDILATKDVLMAMLKEKVKPTIINRMVVYGKYIKKFEPIYEEITNLKKLSYIKNPKDIIGEIVNKTKIKEIYKDQYIKINNLREFFVIAKEIENKEISSRDNLIELLKITSLSNSELDRMLTKYPRVPIITVHQAKGAEFDYVFLAGLQNNIFPNYMAVKEGNEIEEKRLFYVAMTRAKKYLYLSFSEYEHNRRKAKSMLIDYIPKNYLKYM